MSYLCITMGYTLTKPTFYLQGQLFYVHASIVIMTVYDSLKASVEIFVQELATSTTLKSVQFTIHRHLNTTV
jgi:hypothetical protein